MESNTVETLIEYIKDLTGLTNLSNAKAVRMLNFGVDNYTYIALTSSGKWKWDSRNQSDMPRVTTTVDSDTDKVLLETDMVSVNQVEILQDGKYQIVHPIDIRDRQDMPLSAIYNSAGLPKFYDHDGRHLYLYPKSDSSRTLRLTYGRAHPRFTTSNLTQGVGVEPIHEEYIALYAADRLMIGTNDPSRTQIRNELQVKEMELRDLFSKRDQDTQRRLRANIPANFMTRGRGRRR